MKFIVGKKEEMTQIFDDKGHVVPVTVISAKPNFVTQVKTKDKDGYSAVQVGFGERKAKNIAKPQIKHSKGLGNFAGFKEFRFNKKEEPTLNIGDKIETGIFEIGDKVKISSISKGKGFQGVVKKHGFAGGRRTHGQKHSEREPGSIGIGGVQRVFKGTRMAGRMGGERVTISKAKVAFVDSANNRIYLKGAVPGRRGTVVEIKG